MNNRRIISNRKIRSNRLREAREKGTHTKAEWLEMKDFFDHTCCKCFGESGLTHVEKDHITPLFMGGSDALSNIQPLCARCNTGKTGDATDYRPYLAEKLGKSLPLKYTTNG